MRRPPRRDLLTMPYGIWTTKSGAEVMFDRDYRAMWHRWHPGQRATEMTGDEWIRHDRQDYLYVGRVDRKLYEQLLRAEQDFIEGREVQIPIRPFAHMFRPPAKPTPATPAPAATRAHLKLVWCDGVEKGPLFREPEME
jgi:hypothetical protein